MRALRSGGPWVLTAAAAGFVSAAVFTMLLGLDRRTFVAAWSAVAALLWAAYARHEQVRLRVQLARRLPSGIVIGSIAGAILVLSVLRQPASPAPAGSALALDLFWLGGVYGAIDALILSVLPVLALYGTRPGEPEPAPTERLGRAAMALAGSAFVTAAYHAGFREFQGPQLLLPVLSNVGMTACYLISGSAAAPIVAHVAMHVAAVVHGAATTVPLPPHYA
jgi:hypothetical protein